MGRLVRPLAVAIVAARRETVDGLQQYLGSAGVATTSTRRLQDLVSPTVTAVVLFPDEFPADDVTGRIESLRECHPKLLIIVVTNAPQRIARALQPDRDSVAPVVLQKPAFGWTILDSVRERAQLEIPDA